MRDGMMREKKGEKGVEVRVHKKDADKRVWFAIKQDHFFWVELRMSADGQLFRHVM